MRVSTTSDDYWSSGTRWFGASVALDEPGHRDLCVSAHPFADAGRDEVEALIERIYARAHGALIRSHFPTLLCVRDGEGRVVAAAGFRCAAVEPLFLEQYLDLPIEAAVGAALGRVLPRREIAEIGNLASESGSATSLLFFELSRRLRSAGCTAAVATLTRPLRRRLTRAGVRFAGMAQALPERLADTGDDWGRYFSHAPEVAAGEIGWDLLPRSVR